MLSEIKPSDKIIEEAIALRKILHKSPCLSGNEETTRHTIISFLQKNITNAIITDIAETGLLVDIPFNESGNTVVFRADIDALPIDEHLNVFHSSVVPGVSHKCGHDGHAAILAGFALLLNQKPLTCGRILLVFQPAEETGEGAKCVLKDEKFNSISKDFIFGFHNIPGFESGKILIAQKYFASASKGLKIKLIGRPAHAAYPETGKSPATAMAEVITALDVLTQNSDRYDNFVLLTIVYAKLGEQAFGTAPGNAEVFATLRSYDNENMQKLCYDAVLMAKEVAQKYGVEIQISWTDVFDATLNHPGACKLIDDAADDCHFEKHYLAAPFRWSEDFGQYTSVIPGAMFGIGAGVAWPHLHTEHYDFPDEIIEPTIQMLYKIAEAAVNQY